MYFRKIIIYLILCAVLLTAATGVSFARSDEDNLSLAERQQVTVIRSKIFALAESFSGKVDHDGSLFEQLDPLVKKLVAITKPKPLKERFNQVLGGWRQVWGPYSYGNDLKTVDPHVDVDHLYQIIFDDGYYYNTTRMPKNGNLFITILRSSYKYDQRKPDTLVSSVTKLTQIKNCPLNVDDFLHVSHKSEQKTLDNEYSLLPRFMLPLIFKTVKFQEIYTDDVLRIAYSMNQHNKKNGIYIFKRMHQAPILSCR